MKAVVGIFDAGEAQPARDGLVAGGFRPEDVTEMTAIDDVPAYLVGEPEKTASWGWLVGALVGAVVGAALGWVVMSLYSTQYIVLTVLISAAAGAAIGGYLMALYTVRADTQLDLDIHDALGQGKSLLLVRTKTADVDAAVRLMERYHSEHVEIHPIPVAQLEPI
jgi:hypothetical protein